MILQFMIHILKKIKGNTKPPMREDLTKGDIPTLVKRIAIPASIGFFFSTMYNIVDTFYAGMISTEALAAMAISFPVFFIIIALGSGISTAASALVSNALGAKNEEKAKEYAGQSISFAIIASLVITIAGLISAPTLFRILGAEGAYLDLAVSYISIIFMGSIFFLILNVMNGILIALGDTKTFRNLLIGGFFLNLILDPWFMFGGLGVPAMGIRGIALATIVIIGINATIITIKVLRTNLIDVEHLYALIPRAKPFKEILRQGFPASLNMMTIAIGIFVITYYLAQFGSEAVAAYGITTRIEQIALLPTIGLNMAALAIIGQNNGARKIARIRETLLVSLKYGLGIISVGAVIMFAIPGVFLRIFTSDPEVIDIGITALRIAAITSWTYVAIMIITSALQGMKRPMYAFYIGVFRQIVGPVILFYIAINVLATGIVGIWWGIFIVNWIATIITVIYMTHVFKKRVRKLKAIGEV
ncbi:MAG: MATE family efflux transporter [Candidatus Woesearchaeota archaeon]